MVLCEMSYTVSNLVFICIHRMATLPTTTESRKEEWKTIVRMAAKKWIPQTHYKQLKEKTN